MSDIILAKEGVPAEVTDLATRIKAAQGPEIEKMTGWLQSWGQPTGQSEGGGKPDDPVDPARYRALEARLREVERENDFLKKVSAFFAREQR
uniref:DUF305 domain-containing protein n=1 Tax=Pseudarthrobacter raffinosi TaxID=2953651 RepID=UPI0035AB9FC4